MKKTLIALVIGISLLATPITTQAISLDELRAQIISLLHIVLDLQIKLLALDTADISETFDDDFTDGGYDDEDYYTKTAKGYISEEEVDDAEECTDFEQFNPHNNTCYFTCTTIFQCEQIEDKIVDELDSFDDFASEYESFTQNFKEFDGDIERFNEEEITEVAYKITKGENLVISEGVEDAQHLKVKKWFKAISPNDFSDRYIARLVVYRTGEDGDNDTSAFVTENDANSDKYDMYVNRDTFLDGEKEVIFTLIHEFAHIVTLNVDQINRSKDNPNTCNRYFTDEGCANTVSYLNSFYTKFWDGKFNPDAMGSSESNYDKQPSAFVTEYAASNPGEDIAESFATFIFKDNASTASVAEQKSKFFYSYPELVIMRSDIRSGLKIFARKRLR